MKTLKYILLTTVLFISTTVLALPINRGGESNRMSLNSQSRKDVNRTLNDRTFKAGVLVGTDIGGAIPVPFKYIPKTFNPYPQLNIAIGAFAGLRLYDNWDVELSVIYKTVGMKADAMVENQKYEDRSNGLLQYYTGTASMDMSFTMVEFPILVNYSFPNDISKVQFGVYVAYNLKPQFTTLATKGYAGGSPNTVSVIVDPGGQAINMEFSNTLSDLDAGLVLGYKHTVYKRFDVGARISLGLCDIFKSGSKFFDYKMLHMRGSLMISYRIF